MERKAVRRVKLKAEDQGLVTARFATLGVRDRDGDIIRPGAIGGEQRVKVSSYGHGSWGGELPVGAGRAFERGAEAIAELQFFMNTTHGKRGMALESRPSV